MRSPVIARMMRKTGRLTSPPYIPDPEKGDFL
jgi:hypothetical protein